MAFPLNAGPRHPGLLNAGDCRGHLEQIEVYLRQPLTGDTVGVIGRPCSIMVKNTGFGSKLPRLKGQYYHFLDVGLKQIT